MKALRLRLAVSLMVLLVVLAYALPKAESSRVVLVIETMGAYADTALLRDLLCGGIGRHEVHIVAAESATAVVAARGLRVAVVVIRAAVPQGQMVQELLHVRALALGQRGAFMRVGFGVEELPGLRAGFHTGAERFQPTVAAVVEEDEDLLFSAYPAILVGSVVTILSHAAAEGVLRVQHAVGLAAQRIMPLQQWQQVRTVLSSRFIITLYVPFATVRSRSLPSSSTRWHSVCVKYAA